MGQFRSPCPKCNTNYYWFLEAKDHHCEECGEPMTKEQAEEIWWKDCEDYQSFFDLQTGCKYKFTKEEVEDTPWDKLPNVYFNCGAENSREQELRLVKTNHMRRLGYLVPQINFIPKATWDDLLRLEKKED